VLPSVGDKKNKFRNRNWVVLRLSSEHTEYANSWRNVIHHWSINTAPTAVPLTAHPLLWWQSAIAFAGSCTVS